MLVNANNFCKPDVQYALHLPQAWTQQQNMCFLFRHIKQGFAYGHVKTVTVLLVLRGDIREHPMCFLYIYQDAQGM